MPRVAKDKKTTKTTVKKVAVKKTTAKEKVVKDTVEKKVADDKAMKSQSELVKKYRGGAKDTGSVGVQIALLTERIDQLAKHLTKHIHDFDSKRGLLMLVGKRRRLLNYMRKSNEKIYTKLVKDLKLKK